MKFDYENYNDDYWIIEPTNNRNYPRILIDRDTSSMGEKFIRKYDLFQFDENSEENFHNQKIQENPDFEEIVNLAWELISERASSSGHLNIGF